MVISEAVALSKKFGVTDGYKFVNGVLDQLAANARVIEVQALGLVNEFELIRTYFQRDPAGSFCDS